MKIERKTWWRYGVFMVSVIVTFIILLTSIVNKKYDLKVGDIAPVDFRANVDLVDEVTTKALIEDAVASVQNQYTQELEVRRNALKESNDFSMGSSTPEILWFHWMKLPQCCQNGEPMELVKRGTLRSFPLTIAI